MADRGMVDRGSAGALARGFALMFALLSTVMLTVDASYAADDAKYPTNWKGQWSRVVHRDVEVQGAFVQTKPWGLGQEAPLTPEYQQVHRNSMEDQKNGGLGNYPTARCLPSGMPRIMTFGFHEYVITPETTYILLTSSDHLRRIFTDGRDWPKNPKPTYGGYSIGQWIDEDGDGKYDVLEVETRNFRGPRSFDNAGAPLHADNATVIKERIYRDKENPEILHDEMTTIDNALTRPWTVLKTYRRTGNPHFVLNICTVGNNHVQIGNEAYFLSADGHLMPTKKNQAPPDLRYFNQTQN
jgi:hypothetical protein